MTRFYLGLFVGTGWGIWIGVTYGLWQNEILMPIVLGLMILGVGTFIKHGIDEGW
jgi:hypothetical protein